MEAGRLSHGSSVASFADGTRRRHVVDLDARAAGHDDLFSLINYNLLDPGNHLRVGIENFHVFVTDLHFWPAVRNTVLLIGTIIISAAGLDVLANLWAALGLASVDWMPPHNWVWLDTATHSVAERGLVIQFQHSSFEHAALSIPELA